MQIFVAFDAHAMKRKLNEAEQQLADHLIDKYRESVEMRYEFEGLSGRFTLSTQFDEEVIKDIQGYFKECLYPPAEERHKLDTAFESLNSFVSHPAKTWRLLGNMAMAIFKFGTHFPMALKAGMISLEAYLDAKKFERKLLQAAISLNFSLPLTPQQFEACIAELPRREVDAFTADIISLFQSMTDTVLLKKTISILQDVLDKMRNLPEVYSDRDVEGVELGLNILKSGYDLFKDYKESLKKEIIVVIRENEKWYLDQIYAKHKKS